MGEYRMCVNFQQIIIILTCKAFSLIILVILTHMYLCLMAGKHIKKILLFHVNISSELLYVIISAPLSLSTEKYVVL